MRLKTLNSLAPRVVWRFIVFALILGWWGCWIAFRVLCGLWESATP